ncbi:Rz-like lysis system protein LysB [Pseudomonas agarici]|uniref:Rz-like lysis system protein LysB n=1 Tax=Pseudomonas agarici TaxID=46677 RepID=UPI00159FBA3E|nr:Rz-like lysis system protein LysB [Pseudomonas agarici]NWB91603.1 LysB family phage lysis regulatory protein [Pseudomonas agarici]
MSTLRQALYGIALLGALALLVWGQQQRINAAVSAKIQAEQNTRTARQDAERNLTTAHTLRDTLQQERLAQQQVREQQEQLRQGLARREQQIEALKRENSELRDWAARPLPDAARWLRERPAVTGADAYRQWLSGRGALQPAGDPPQQ